MTNSKTSTGPIHSIPYKPWVYFLLFLLVNAILSYSPLSLESKLWVGLLGWALPFALVLWGPTPNDKKPIFQTESLASFPLSIGLILAAVYLTAHALFLFSSHWPVPDDSFFASVSLELSQKWEWRIFFDQTQHPPLFNWLLAFFFKLTTPSIFSIRLFPFLLSLLTLPLAYGAARKFFPRSIAFLCLGLSALSFWPLYTSRYCMYMPMLFAWECLAFYALGRFLKSNPGQSSGSAWSLGIVLGLGFWLAIAWPAAAAMILLPVLLLFRRSPAKTEPNLWRIGIPIVLLAFSFAWISLLERNGLHMQYLLALRPEDGWIGRLTSALSNFTSLVWGCDRQNSYGPVWGGMLNPLEGALFFIGFLELIRSLSSSLARWIFASFFLFLIPGLITNTFDIFRNSLALPILLLICALGAHRILLEIPSKKRILALVAALLVSIPLSLVHFEKSLALDDLLPEKKAGQEALKILTEISRQEGPGLILLDLQPNYGDLTLPLAVYPFNAARNQKHKSSQTRWAALVLNGHYSHFLAERFPDAKWHPMGPDIFWQTGGLVLGIIPLEDSRRAQLFSWLEMDRRLHSLAVQDSYDHSQAQTEQLFQELLASENLAGNDPFLVSALWERALYIQRNRMKPSQLLPFIQKALEKGYPLPHLLVAEGLVLIQEGKTKEARVVLEQAVRSPENKTRAAEILTLLDQGGLNNAPGGK